MVDMTLKQTTYATDMLCNELNKSHSE